VFQDIAWCPTRSQVKIGFIPGFVSKIKLFETLETGLLTQNLTLGFDEDHLPNRDWLVNALKSACPDHEFFSYGQSKS